MLNSKYIYIFFTYAISRMFAVIMGIIMSEFNVKCQYSFFFSRDFPSRVSKGNFDKL